MTGVDLVLGQHEVAHDHGLSSHRLEGEPAAERKARLERDAVERHFEVGARQAHAVDAAGCTRAGFAERLADLAPVRTRRRNPGSSAKPQHRELRGALREGLVFAWFVPLVGLTPPNAGHWTIVAAVHSSQHVRSASGMALRDACVRARAEDADMCWFERAG